MSVFERHLVYVLGYILFSIYIQKIGLCTSMLIVYEIIYELCVQLGTFHEFPWIIGQTDIDMYYMF